MTAKKVIITGSTKFIGRHVLEEFLARGMIVTCLARPASDTSALRALNVPLIEGDLNCPRRLAEKLQGYEYLIHVPNLAKMADMAGLLRVYETAALKRVVFISSTGIFTQLPAQTKPRRQAAEKLIIDSRLNYTVLRPTMVYGGSEDGNVARLLRFCWHSPVMPIFGSGEYKQQPVHVRDLAWAIAEVLDHARTERQLYNLGGGEILSYKALVRLSYRALGRQGTFVHLPIKPIASAFRIAAKLGLPTPLKEEQILRLAEDKVFDLAPAQAAFTYTPRSFASGVSEEASLFLEHESSPRIH